MIIRIVKMSFLKADVDNFKLLFEKFRPAILASTGCLEVTLHKNLDNDLQFFTISKWQSANDLEAYRKSAIFNEVWASVKPKFSSAAEAWSLEK